VNLEWGPSSVDRQIEIATHEEIAIALQFWARGSLPHQAAVEFLIATGTRLYPRHPMLAHENEHGERGAGVLGGIQYWWIDVWGPDGEDLAEDAWLARLGGMSGGEFATWTLIRSLLVGELQANFWRLDGSRKRAFIEALTRNVS
jgi:hypothetical protein